MKVAWIWYMIISVKENKSQDLNFKSEIFIGMTQNTIVDSLDLFGKEIFKDFCQIR